jgi:DNA invertase Pin-like site-specific DNA recombinase
MALIQEEGAKESSVCAIYTRQSSNPSSDLTSCQVQFEACEAFIRAQKHSGWRWIDEHFNDEGWSGATLDRPALQRLLAKIRNGEIDRLLVYRLDRLSRSVIDSVSLLKEFRECGIDLVIVTAPEIGSTAHDSLILNLLSIFAEFERDLVAKRIADARAALKRQGRRVGGALPFGYDADPMTKQLVVNSEEIKQVRAMFEMAADGMPPSEIARIANDNNWRTKKRKAKRSGKESGGNLWTARQVLATLSNPVYMGKIDDAGLLRDGIHIPIVPETLFSQVRSQLVSRRTRSPGRKERTEFWMLKRLIRCTRCGRIMSTSTTRHGSKIYRYYRCRSMNTGKNPCRKTQIPAGQIESEVCQVLSDLPKRVQEIPLTDRMRGIFLRFSTACALLSPEAVRHALPKVIQEIIYDADSGQVTVNLDLEAIELHALEEPQLQ